MEIIKIKSEKDGLELELTIIEPKGKPKAIVQISHGMSEHKERYYHFMNYLASYGYVCVIHDHRGHGASVKDKNDLGYFYTDDISFIVDDLYQVTKYMKERYKDLDYFLFSHSMGTLVARNYLKSYDSEIKKIVLCGPPTKNNLTEVAILLAKLSSLFGGRKVNIFLNKLTFGSYNKNNELENEWICSNRDTVNNYNSDDLCGFIFTTNGFLNLYKLMRGSFDKSNWNITNKDLDILVIAGEDDPVIQNIDKFNDLIEFLKEVGYVNIKSHLYDGKRHELLNELENEKIYQDILSFLSE